MLLGSVLCSSKDRIVLFNDIIKVWKTRVISSNEDRSVSSLVFDLQKRVSRRGIWKALFICDCTYCRLCPRLHKNSSSSLVLC